MMSAAHEKVPKSRAKSLEPPGVPAALVEIAPMRSRNPSSGVSRVTLLAAPSRALTA